MPRRLSLINRVYLSTTRHPIRLMLTLIAVVLLVCVAVLVLRIRTERQAISEIARRHPGEIGADQFYRYIGVDWRRMSSREERYHEYARPFMQLVGDEIPFPVIAVYLCNVELTDEDVRSLSRLPYLESANLSGQRVTQHQFVQLAEIDSLVHIQLYDADVSSSDVESFQKLRPDVEIEW